MSWYLFHWTCISHPLPTADRNAKDKELRLQDTPSRHVLSLPAPLRRKERRCTRRTSCFGLQTRNFLLPLDLDMYAGSLWKAPRTPPTTCDMSPNSSLIYLNLPSFFYGTCSQKGLQPTYSKGRQTQLSPYRSTFSGGSYENVGHLLHMFGPFFQTAHGL